MDYAASDHWNQFFTKLKDAGTDLDWGNQWTKVHLPVLKSTNIQTVLDLGCGTGNDALRLAKEGFTVTGMDFSDEAVQLGRLKAQQLVHDGGNNATISNSQNPCISSFLIFNF